MDKSMNVKSLHSQSIETLQAEIFNSTCTEHYDVVRSKT